MAMADSPKLTITQSVAESIFIRDDVVVLEAQSDVRQPLRQFHSVSQLRSYANDRHEAESPSIHIGVYYSDMRGELLRRTVPLDPIRFGPKSYREVVEGWGLIWVYLKLGHPSPVGSFISANSQKRAKKWASTKPDFGNPDDWDWAAVGRHLRRIRRALKRAQ